MANTQIFKFSGYCIDLGGDLTERDVVDALKRVGLILDVIVKHPMAESRDVEDWEYGDDNHPLNSINSPVELCEKYFDQEVVYMSDKNRIDKYADGIVTTDNGVELSPSDDDYKYASRSLIPLQTR